MTDQPHHPNGKASGAGDGSPRTPEIDYPGLVQRSLRKVVRDVLAQVADLGLPGEHHFYLGFATAHPGVGLSESLRARHPLEMTIVLQHDFRDLEVDDEGFDVTLRFGGMPQSLRVPFGALISFYDPAAQFMLNFEPEDVELGDDAADGASSERRPPSDVLRDAGKAGPRAVPAAADDESDDDRPAGEVVSIEAFRRK